MPDVLRNKENTSGNFLRTLYDRGLSDASVIVMKKLTDCYAVVMIQ